MPTKICYLRDHKNIHQKKDGTYTRGNPIAVLITEIDREQNITRYAYATVHPSDCFNKKQGRNIAFARLKKNPLVVEGALTKSHDINNSVMRDLFASPSEKVSNRLRAAIGDWLSSHNGPRDRDTIPSPTPPVV